MKSRFIPALSLFTVAILLGLWTGCQSPVPTPWPPDPNTATNDIPNFSWVDKDWGICRGGQPTLQGWYWLSVQPAGQSGQGVGKVNHVIKLDSETEGADDVAWTQLGMSCDYNPINLNEQMDPLLHAELDRKMHEIAHLISPGTFIHCEHGQDRTGALVYAYRRNCGWTDAQARLEMMTNGFHVELLGLKYFVDHYVPELSVTNTPKAWKALNKP